MQTTLKTGRSQRHSLEIALRDATPPDTPRSDNSSRVPVNTTARPKVARSRQRFSSLPADVIPVIARFGKLVAIESLACTSKAWSGACKPLLRPIFKAAMKSNAEQLDLTRIPLPHALARKFTLEYATRRLLSASPQHPLTIIQLSHGITELVNRNSARDALLDTFSTLSGLGQREWKTLLTLATNDPIDAATLSLLCLQPGERLFFSESERRASTLNAVRKVDAARRQRHTIIAAQEILDHIATIRPGKAGDAVRMQLYRGCWEILSASPESRCLALRAAMTIPPGLKHVEWVVSMYDFRAGRFKFDDQTDMNAMRDCLVSVLSDFGSSTSKSEAFSSEASVLIRLLLATLKLENKKDIQPIFDLIKKSGPIFKFACRCAVADLFLKGLTTGLKFVSVYGSITAARKALAEIVLELGYWSEKEVKAYFRTLKYPKE